ncbi:MAG: hypothetical protein ACOY93_13315 [Bacillota bacterium]
MTQEQAKVPVEIVAAITAAIAAMLDQPTGSFQIRSIQPVTPAQAPAPSAWAKAGLIQTHLTRASFRNR